MRNPWGVEKYKGPWRDDDTRWTADFKKQANLVKKNDGIFYMPVENFKNAFVQWTVLMYQDWKTKHVDFSGTGKYFRNWSVTSPVSQKLIVALDYQNARQRTPHCKGPKVWFNLYAKQGGSTVAGPSGVSTSTGYGHVEIDAEQGKTYDIMVINWSDASATADFTITSYSSSVASAISSTPWG